MMSLESLHNSPVQSVYVQYRSNWQINIIYNSIMYTFDFICISFPFFSLPMTFQSCQSSMSFTFYKPPCPAAASLNANAKSVPNASENFDQDLMEKIVRDPWACTERKRKVPKVLVHNFIALTQKDYRTLPEACQRKN